MKIVFMGTPDFAVGTLEALIDGGHEISAVVTQTDKPKGRGMDLTFSPVKECALKHGIKVLQPERIRDNADFEAELKELAPDVCVVVAYGKILPKSILDIPRHGCINVHASILPKYRGSAPIQWCIVNGDTVSGVTTMRMDEGMDTGDMIDVLTLDIPATMTGEALHDSLAQLGAQIINKTLEKIENGTAVYTKQDENKATYVKMLSRADGLLDFNKSAKEIADKIRGFDPWPSAFTFFENKMYKFFTPSVGKSTTEIPGTLVSANTDGVAIACGDGKLLICKGIQAAGSRRMTVSEYLNGHTLPIGRVASNE